MKPLMIKWIGGKYIDKVTDRRLTLHLLEYHAFEIDKFAMKVANHNYPDIIQHGDAFQIREWESNQDD